MLAGGLPGSRSTRRFHQTDYGAHAAPQHPAGRRCRYPDDSGIAGHSQIDTTPVLRCPSPTLEVARYLSTAWRGLSPGAPLSAGSAPRHASARLSRPLHASSRDLQPETLFLPVERLPAQAQTQLQGDDGRPVPSPGGKFALPLPHCLRRPTEATLFSHVSSILQSSYSSGLYQLRPIGTLVYG